MAYQNHHQNCNPVHDRHSGVTQDCRNVVQKHNLQITFRLECIGCCFAYLQSRNYQAHIGTSHDLVCFSLPGNLINNIPIGRVSAFVNATNATVNGQISTGYDYNLGNRVVRSVANHRTYQLYSNTPELRLSVGFTGTTRMESVAITVVRPRELCDIYFNYADAAVVELYRNQRHPPLSSLSGPSVTGHLCLRNPQRDS